MSETADVLDGAFWDYDPEADVLSPLVTTDRYFRDFPWEPDPIDAPGSGSARSHGTTTGRDVTPR